MENYQPVRLSFNTFEPVIRADPSLAPILFLHGLTAFKEHWGDIPQIVSNATKRKAYALDARNHGDSEWSDDFSFDINADDVIHFMDVNGMSRAILVGHSMGGVTAIKAALRWPDRIEKIIVEDMVVRKISKQFTNSILACVSNSLKALEILSDDLDEDGAKKFIRRYYLSNLPPEMAKMAKENSREEMTDFVKLRRGVNGRFTFKTNIRVIKRALMDHDSLSSETRGVYEEPALFIYGQLSPILVGADAHHIRQYFPNAVFEGIEDASHDVHTDRPLEFTDALLKFIS